jgi:hypothetical protein
MWRLIGLLGPKTLTLVPSKQLHHPEPFLRQFEAEAQDIRMLGLAAGAGRD